jgi:hypothetical protein
MDLWTVLQVQRNVGAFRRADEYRDLGAYPGFHPGYVYERGKSLQVFEIGSFGEVIDGEHRMRLAAAERRL